MTEEMKNDEVIEENNDSDSSQNSRQEPAKDEGESKMKKKSKKKDSEKKGKIEKQLEELSEVNQSLQEENESLKEALQRKAADFENYRKRVQRQMIEQEVMANKELILRILPIIDNFERGLNASEESENLDAIVEGFKMSYNQFMDLFKEFHVKPIESEGHEFDHNLHEALMMEERDDVDYDNTVVEEFEKGYMMGDKVIRHSKVKVAKKTK